MRFAATGILQPSGHAVYRTAAACAALVLVVGGAARAQMPAPSSDSVSTPRQLSPNYWRWFGLGFMTSLALHESAHIMTSVALGTEPSFGFNDGRPTIYSGIDASTDPHKQFLFSASGITVQNLLDEAILDIPHPRGSAFERGILGGGLGTTIFYLTIGRTGSVSDVEFMARTHGMTKTQATFLYGGVALSHIWRISRDSHYANFFARPDASGAYDVGVDLKTP